MRQPSTAEVISTWTDCSHCSSEERRASASATRQKLALCAIEADAVAVAVAGPRHKGAPAPRVNDTPNRPQFAVYHASFISHESLLKGPAPLSAPAG
jgi:hypothetical protein